MYLCTRTYISTSLVLAKTINQISRYSFKCGTVVPSQGFLSLREVWRHTEVGYVRNRTLEGQQRGNTSESASRSQDDLEVL